MDAKQLKKLANACRKAGIKKYSCPEFSFELDEVTPKQRQSRKSSKILNTSELIEDKVDSDQELTDEQLLLWSSSGGNEVMV